jgi:hypothetical protein
MGDPEGTCWVGDVFSAENAERPEQDSECCVACLTKVAWTAGSGGQCCVSRMLSDTGLFVQSKGIVGVGVGGFKLIKTPKTIKINKPQSSLEHGRNKKKTQNNSIIYISNFRVV